ncbi:hypothetical protein [Clostridium perfringens]|uniref:Helix-turn-helix domain of resolvase n=1 Tax=Clostridium perfringens F262 TaxID=883064 RepID=A0AAV3F8F2_CLOPF|nr:hypothetical protein [Clostridium perfringens]EIA15597.1 hypothetical protein HA1_16067 [Clostridium perfringens F262]
MKKWQIFNEEVENKISEIDERVVIVSKEHLEKLKEYDIPFYTFSEKIKKCYFVNRGVKKKRFSKEQCNIIKNQKESGMSYKELSYKYECSTRTIYQIIKGKY